MSIHFSTKFKFYFLFFVLFFVLNAFSQTLINLEKWTHTAPQGALDDSISVYRNQFVDTYFERLIRETNQKICTNEDSAAAFKFVLNFSRTYQQYQNKFLKGTPKDNEGASDERLSLLKTMQKDLEDAFRLYPAYPRLKLYLSNFLFLQYEQYYLRNEQWKNYLQVATNHLFLMPPENKYTLFSSIGAVYNRLNEYKLACAAYDSSITYLFNYYEDSLRQENKKFKNSLYISLLARANCEEKMLLDEAALRSWKHAALIAADTLKKGIDSRIRRNQWDDGNLPGFEKYYSAQLQMSQNNLKEARTQLLEVLPILKTPAARYDVERTLALNEYRLGYRYQALDRIYKIITSYKQSSPGTAENDSVYNSYLQTYAQLCLFQGNYEFFTLKRHLPAFIYLSKAAEIKNPNQRHALFLLTYLLTGDKRDIIHIQKASEYGHRAWNFEEQELSLANKKLLAQRLEWIYVQQGNFDQALDWRKAFLALE